MLPVVIFLCYLLAAVGAWCAVFTQPVFGHSGLALGVAFVATGLALSCIPAVRKAP